MCKAVLKPYSICSPMLSFLWQENCESNFNSKPKLLPARDNIVCLSALKFHLSPLLVSTEHPKPFTATGMLSLHSTPRAVKVLTKGQSSPPPERENNTLKFKLAHDKSSGCAPRHPRADVLSSSQDTGWAGMDGINLQFAPCSSVLVFSYVISAAGRM